MGGDHAAAAQDGDAVGQREDLVEPVRDVEHARARAADLADHGEQPLDLVVRQHRGRLVEHQHAVAAVPALQRRGDRDHRALDRRGGGQRAVDVEVDAEAGEDAAGLALLLAPADAAQRAAGEAAVQREVVHGVELEDEPEVLVDEAQPVRDGVAERERLAVELRDGAGIGRVVAGERLDQRRLARAVLADERVDLARADVERRVDQRARGAERLGERADAQDGRRLGAVSLRDGLRERVCHVTMAAAAASTSLLVELN